MDNTSGKLRRANITRMDDASIRVCKMNIRSRRVKKLYNYADSKIVYVPTRKKGKKQSNKERAKTFNWSDNFFFLNNRRFKQQEGKNGRCAMKHFT